MKLTIRNRVLLIGLIPQLVLALILGGYFIQGQYTRAILELELHGNQQVEYLAQLAELPMLTGDREYLQRLTFNEIASHGPGLVVVVFDAEQNIVAAAGDQVHRELVLECVSGQIQCSEDRRQYVFQQLIMTVGHDETGDSEEAGALQGGEYLLGSVVVAYNDSSLAQLRYGLVRSSLIIVALALAFALVVVWRISRGLSRPIERLLRAVNRFRRGDFSARTTPRGSGELLDLEQGINMMAEQVEEASANLNQRIDEATAELSKALDDLEHRHQDLITARRQTDQANSSKDLFLAKMSHELRTPLATVIGYSRLLQRAEDAQHKQEYSLIMNKAVEILQTTVDDILDFVKLQREVVQLVDVEFDLVQCLENAVAMQVPTAHDKKLEIISDCSDMLPQRVYGDSVRLAQIVTNLLNNAIKFTESGQVMLTAARLDSAEAGAARICLSVKDSGIGIESDKQARLFQPFVQADENTNRHFGGSGLGLSIVSRLVESMGGKIGLVSEPGRGTEVSVELDLPVRLGPVVVDRWASPDQRIAVYDPHPDVCRICARLLAASGFSVDEESDRGAFLDLLVGTKPALAIFAIDIEEDITEQWHRVRMAHDGKLLMLVSNEKLVSDVSDQLSANESILVKPIRSNGFRAAVRSLLLGLPRPDVNFANGTPLPQVKSSVLVVEDNLLNLRLIMTQLEEVGATVTGVSSGFEALKVLEHEMPDVALVDVHMPGMDGITLARRLAEIAPALPVYALTANVIGTEEQDLRGAGVRQILYKPIQEKEILQILTQKSIEGPVEATQDLPAATMQGETTLVVPKGITPAEVIDELQILHSAIERGIQGEYGDDLRSSIHKLQGVTRLFTRGPMIEAVASLAQNVRSGRTVESQALFADIGQEIARLAEH